MANPNLTQIIVTKWPLSPSISHCSRHSNKSLFLHAIFVCKCSKHQQQWREQGAYCCPKCNKFYSLFRCLFFGGFAELNRLKCIYFMLLWPYLMRLHIYWYGDCFLFIDVTLQRLVTHNQIHAVGIEVHWMTHLMIQWNPSMFNMFKLRFDWEQTRSLF